MVKLLSDSLKEEGCVEQKPGPETNWAADRFFSRIW